MKRRMFILLLILGSMWLAADVVKFAGSTTCREGFVDDAEAAFEKMSGHDMQIEGGGSSLGVKAALAGSVDVGGASRPLKDSEKEAGAVATTVAWDAIAVIVNKDNPVNELSIEQLKMINTGQITNWKEVGGNDEQIIVVTGPKTSGTRAFFQEVVMDDAPFTPKAMQAAESVLEVEKVIGFKLAIGAVSTAAPKMDQVKIIKVKDASGNSYAPDRKNVKSGKYPISRPLNLVTKGAPAGNAKAYIDFILSEEGQKLVARKCVPVN